MSAPLPLGDHRWDPPPAKGARRQPPPYPRELVANPDLTRCELSSEPSTVDTGNPPAEYRHPPQPRKPTPWSSRRSPSRPASGAPSSAGASACTTRRATTTACVVAGSPRTCPTRKPSPCSTRDMSCAPLPPRRREARRGRPPRRRVPPRRRNRRPGRHHRGHRLRAGPDDHESRCAQQRPAGTWRGEWISAAPADAALFDLARVGAEQGALFA